MSQRFRICFTCWILGFAGALTAAGQSITLDQLALDPPMGNTNRLSISLQTSIGNDSDIADVTGTMAAILDVDWQGGPVVPTGFTLTGGEVTASDVQFTFLSGLVSITTNDVGGTPSTPNPPSVVTGGMFAASDHLITLDRGTIEAPDTTIDLAMNPIPVMGTGSGAVSVASLGGDLYEAVFTLPVEFNEAFEVMNVPVVGTVTGNILGFGTFVARQQFMLTSLPGDYDFDGDLDCDDIDLLQSEILAGSTNLLFDVNGDGMVTLPDYQAWVTDLKETLLGDANLDFFVDGSDFNSWNANKFTSGRGWCDGDFSGDGTVDGTDFNTWNANKFTSVDITGSQVPEPTGTGLGLCGILLFICTKMRLTNVHIIG